MDRQRRDRRLFTVLLVVAVLGFGLHQGARLLDPGSGPYSADPFAAAGVAAGGFVCLYVAALAYLGKIHSATMLFAVGVVCSLVRVVLGEFFPSSATLALAAQIIGGAGWVLIILCWMQVFSAYQPRYFLPLIAGGFLLLTLAVPFATLLGEHARQGVFLASLLLSFGLLAAALAKRNWVAKRMLSMQPPRTSMRGLVRRMGRTVMTTVAFSATCGFLVQLDIQSGLYCAQLPETSLAGALIASALLIWVLSARIERIDFDMAFALCAIALLGLVAMRVVVPASVGMTGSLIVMLLHLFYCLLWMAVTGDAYERQLPGFFLLGVAVGCAQLSIAFGRWLCDGLLAGSSASASQTLVLVVCALGSAVALNVIALAAELPGRQDGEGVAEEPFSASAKSPEFPGGDNRPDVATLALEAIVQRHGLSKREAEIILEYSTGRSARAIADANLISEHTVKTHLKRAYAKLGVHSRQELLDLLEEVEASLHRAGALA